MNNSQVLEFVIKAKQTEPSLSAIAKDYKQNIEKAKNETLTLNQAFKKLNVKPMAALRAEGGELKKALDKIKIAYKQGKVPARDYARAQTALRDKMAAVKKEGLGLSSAFAKMKSGLLGLGATIYTLGRSFNAFSEFTQKMAEVRTLVKTSNSDFNTLKESILSMTKELPQSATELASAEYDIISAGVKLKNSTEVLKLSAKAAVAGVTDTKTAANAGIGVLNAYGMSADKLSHVYDVLFATVKDGVTTFPELAQSIGTVLPVARSAGVNIETLGATIAALTKAGIKTPEAVNGLRGAIVALSSATPDARKEMNKLGISWKGLVPTLRELKRYANNPEIMRRLIPDVRARMAVLALVQNFDNLNNALKDTANAGGAAQAAFDKMKDTPENQIKLFKNQVTLLFIEVGKLVSKGLLPLIKGLNSYIDSLKYTNTPTKIFLGILGGFSSLAVAWKLGLGSMVTGLGDLLEAAHTTGPALTELSTAVSSVKLAATGGIVISVAFAGYNIYKLIDALRQLHNVQKESQNLAESEEKSAQKYKQAKDTEILSTKQYLKLSKDEQQAYSNNIASAYRYYGYLGSAAILAKKNRKEIEKYKEKTAEYLVAMTTLSKVSKQAANALSQGLQETHTHFVINKADTVKLKNALTKAYNSAIAGVRKWSEKVTFYENKIRQERTSTADLIRGLNRKTMSQEDAWYDKKKEAEEKLSKAKKALSKGDYKTAKKLTEQAKGLYESLATKVTTTTEDNKEKTVISLQDATNTAVQGIKNASSIMQQILGKQKSNAQSILDSFKNRANAIKSMMDELIKPGTKKIDIKLEDYNSVMQKLNTLCADVVKTIHIRQVVETVEKHRFGGLAGYAVGGALSGYGGGDIVPALLEPGEFILRKESVKKYGVRLLSALNNLSAPINLVPRFQAGGIIKNFNVGDFSIPIDIAGYWWDQWKILQKAVPQSSWYKRIKTYLGPLTAENWVYTFVEEKFKNWFKKQEVENRFAIQEAKTKKVESEQKATLDLNLNGKTYPVEGDSNIIQELLAEIKKLKAMGYA